MPRKHSYYYLKKYIEDNSNGECILLSEEYKNDNTPLKLQCKCGEIFYRTFKKVKLGRFNCEKCKLKKSHDKYAFSLDQVKKMISEKNCEYISGEYINNTSKLKIRCSCGNIFVKDLNHFNRGQNRCTKCGKELSRKAKFKYDLDKCRKILSRRGYELLEDKYIDCETPLKCKCPKGHIVNIKISHFKNHQSGCKQCANERLKGENHYNYKGGESEVIDYLRKHIHKWKVDVMIKYKNKCFLTDSKKDCVIHHIKSFNTILKESLNELNLCLHRKIKDYSTDDFKNLENLVIFKHTVENGVLLQRKVHNKFHSLYGKGNNTLEQFIDFINKYYPQRIYFSANTRDKKGTL